MFKAIIFNVERGFCAFVRSPNNYGLLIDCGGSSDFSPIKHIIDNEAQHLQKFNGQDIAYFIVSHPHEDHISDIRRLIVFCPAIIYGRNYDWDEIKDPEHKFEYENLDTYSKWKQGLSSYEGPSPEWGMELWKDGLSVSEAKQINSDRQAFVNNSSIIVSLNYRGFKFFFAGDLMKDGWEALLKRDSFRKALEGTRFFIASHHGHSSGYTSEVFKVCKPWVNIVSEKSGEEVESAYSSEGNAIGVKIGNEVRRMLTTRKDGSIAIEVDENGRWYYSTF